MTKSNIMEFCIPEWAVCPLINGDYSGLEPEDEIKINEFIQETIEKYGHACFSLPDQKEIDLGFRITNDIDRFGSDCCKLLLIPYY